MTENGLALLLDPALDPIFAPPPLAGVPSAWYGHVPFAQWLVAAARPDCLVELGTHNGVSYTAFCGAVQRAGLPTRCYAVDTWKGDEHAGFYGEEVYENLRRFHAERYAGFSEMLRTTFEAALPYFPDGGIDLLHIDGLHTYEAVKRDFEQWRPKLSPRSVVLFHDTNVREREFGVWRFWAELREQFPGFEFLHGHGLGVLVTGTEAPERVRALAAMTDPAEIARLRERFATIGQIHIRTAGAEQRTERLQAHIAQVERQRNAANARIEALRKQVDKLRERFGES
jgi:O-antigen biosynthesis protein